MSKPLSLFIAIVAVALFCGVAFAISHSKPWLAVLSGIAAIFVIGAGFIIKARTRRKQGKQ